jgi:multicomponent Na+:H+ antiporter subunit C
MIYALCIVLFLLGLYGVLVKKNLIKIIISLAMMNNAINLFFILLAYRKNGVVPILSFLQPHANLYETAVDPLPQALVLTSVVIGLGVTALMVALAIRLYYVYGTFDITKMRKLRG